MLFSGAPDAPVAVPLVINEIAAGRPIRPVWTNNLGCVTVEIGEVDDRHFVKWVPAGVAIDLAGEAARMRWAVQFTAVPVVVDEGRDDGGSWLLTEAVPGEMAVMPRWKAEPATAVRAIGRGLRAFHDALPVSACAFSYSVDDRIAEARRLAESGALTPEPWHKEHKHLGVEGAIAAVADPPPIDELVVCHGDTCAPNLLIGDNGEPTGWVDLGDLGVGDRWADLAIATWSTTWNYGPDWEDPLLAAYGIERDEERIRYYRLLYDLGP